MRKGISFLLVLCLILGSFTVVFAKDAEAPADVKDTLFEAAVVSLMEKGIISGYPDGSFRPGDYVSRSEACVIVVKAIGASEEELNKAALSSFPDLADHEWAVEYINYAASQGVISGYPDGMFVPNGRVTTAEMASMLVRGLGYDAKDLPGKWPNNFMTKAVELGIFKNISYSAQASALRGHVALMTNHVADDIAEANLSDQTTEPDEDEPDDPDKDSAGFLADFTGRAYGVLLSTAKVLNGKGDKVDEYKFLIGNKILYLETNGKVATDSISVIEDHLEAGDLYGLRMNDGVVTKLASSDDGFLALNSPEGYKDFTAGSGWAEVADLSNYVIETKLSYNERDQFTVMDDASIYVAVIENGVITGYKPGTIRDIRADKQVRLYSVTKDNPGVVEIVLVK